MTEEVEALHSRPYQTPPARPCMNTNAQSNQKLQIIIVAVYKMHEFSRA